MTCKIRGTGLKQQVTMRRYLKQGGRAWRSTNDTTGCVLPHEFTARLVLNLDATMSARSASAEPTETSRLLVYDDSDRQP
jgi:hypothetical protein